MIMRKNLLLFLAAFCSVVAVNATSYVVNPTTPNTSDNIRRTLRGDYGTVKSGDTIVLLDGVFTEKGELVLNTNVVFITAEGAQPTISAQYPIKITSAGITFNGITFTQNYVRLYSGTSGDVLFENCTFKDLKYACLMDKADVAMESLTFNNCLFQNIAENAINNSVNGSTAPGVTKKFTVTNSTFVSCSNAGETWTIMMRDNDKDETTSGPECLIDYCTFYNCSHKEGSTYMVYFYHIGAEATISNCVTSHSENQSNTESFTTYKIGFVKNCVFNNCAGAGWMTEKTNVINADPQFIDPANGDFSFALTSPLFLAATDGSHIGDPRWGVNVSGDVDITTELNISNKVCGTAQASVDDATLIEFYPSKKSSTDTALWAGWVVNTEALAYKIAAEVTVASGWSLNMFLCDIVTGALVNKYEYPSGSSSAISPVDLGTWDLSQVPAGQYLLKVKNNTAWGNIQLKSLVFTSAGGAEVNLPGTLPNEDAILGGNDKVKVDEEGYICFSGDGNVPNCFAKWNANFTKKGEFGVSINVATTNGHKYKVQVLKGEAVVGEAEEPSQVETQGEIILKGNIKLQEAGTYTIKLINQTAHSNARVKDITFTYTGGGIVEIPGTLKPADAMLSEKAFIDNDTIIFAPRGSEGHTPEGWAKWNVHLENDAICQFTANCFRFSGNTMTIKISVYNADKELVYNPEAKSVANSGNSAVDLDSKLLPAGDYVIQMQNTTQYSRGRLMSVVVTAQPIITITDDSDIDFTDYAGQMVTVQLRRTFKANMWNPICLPFGVEHSKLQSILNCETSYLLNNASLENQKLFVELAASQYNDIYNGSPYMIKPSEDVENPIFENVKIMETPHATATEKGPLTLRGSFESKELSNPSHVLLVGANNTLFFPSDEHPYIKSMRAYFILKDVEPSQMPRFAAFVEPGNAPTEMIIVGGEAERQKCHRKVLVDGQIRIQHEGKCYSILGLER